MSLTVDIAESTSFSLLRMMQSTSPVYSDVALAPVQSRSALHTAAGADPTELEQTIEHRAVISNVVFALLLCVAVHVVWCYPVQEVDILVCVELGHFELCRRLCALQCC